MTSPGISIYVHRALAERVGNWLNSEYRPAIGSILQDTRKTNLDAGTRIGQAILDQVSARRQLRTRPILIQLPRKDVEWLAINLSRVRRFGLLGSIGAFGAAARRALPGKRGRPRLSLDSAMDRNNLRSDRQMRRYQNRVERYRASF